MHKFVYVSGLESLPLAPAAPFLSQSQHQPSKLNVFDQFVYTPSQCSHGPNLAGNFQYQSVPQSIEQSIPQSYQQQTISQAIPQLQTVYGVPPQSLDVSQSSSFEIAQNAGAQGLLTSYGPPASGIANSFGDSTNIHEENSPTSSYGPPPSGNPADNFAHGSQKSISSVQIDSTSQMTSNVNDTHADELPGLSSVGLDIISAQKSVPIELPVQGQLGTYSLQFQAADPLASQTNGNGAPDHQKLLNDNSLLQSIIHAIEEPKGNDVAESAPTAQSLDAHPDVNEFINSSVGQDALSDVKTE